MIQSFKIPAIEYRQVDGKSDEWQNMRDEWRCMDVGDLVF